MVSKLNFSLTQLEYILAVHKHGHFAKAAEACHVTQPTLSMQIQKVEEVLGVVLFDRTKKPILLTSVGEQLIKQIQAVVFEARKINSIVDANLGHGIAGELSLGVIPTIAPYLLPRLLPTVKQKMPELKLIITEMQTHQIIDALNSDEIDVGILATPLKISQIEEQALYYEPFYILSHKDHPLSRLKKAKYSGLKYDDIWLLNEGHCFRNQVLDICSLRQGGEMRRNFQFESGSIETLKSLVDAFGGYTLVPQLAMQTHGRHSQIIEFERPTPAREVGLVYRRRHYKKELIDALGEAVIKSIPEGLTKNRKGEMDVLPID